MCVSVCAVSSCGMLSLQEKLADTSGTNQRRRRRASGHKGSKGGEKREEESGRSQK